MWILFFDIEEASSFAVECDRSGLNVTGEKLQARQMACLCLQVGEIARTIFVSGNLNAERREHFDGAEVLYF